MLTLRSNSFKKFIFSLWSNNNINCIKLSEGYKINIKRLKKLTETLKAFEHIENY